VFDAGCCDGICDHGEHAVVVRMDLVHDVVVNEDIAWTRESDIQARGSARVHPHMEMNA
jgi:hypothetical protein